ncbi:high-glucose-regulated protein 8 [Pseudohyphozyma bogoriensis]|nr:high-glucose-regulated protein 8 [Pseudohyphozyma bogoriensis]
MDLAPPASLGQQPPPVPVSTTTTTAPPPPPAPSKRPSLTVATSTPPSSSSLGPGAESPASHALSPSSSAGGSARSFHTRSQSLSEATPSPEMATANALPPGDASSLVRRHHTLSSSRLVRLERSKVRVALQGVGLSAADQEFYVPDSPVGAPPHGWSDAGHGGYHSPDPTLTSFPTLTNSPASTSSFESSPLPQPKRSSFVVVRAGKGDVLAERRQPMSPPRQAANRTITPPKPQLKHRNSLKPFLEADNESTGDKEDWEQSLQDERDKEEMELRSEGQRSAAFTTPPLQSSATFGSPFGSLGYTSPHTRATTISHHPQQQSIASVTNSDAWINGGTGEDAGGLRRHQSLNFRHEYGGEHSSEEGGWPDHSRGVSEDTHPTFSSIGFSATHSGNRPSSLSLSQTPSSLSHSNSISSHHSHSGATGLSHSNSLTSHHGTPLSPVGGFRTPWSPTAEEEKQLGRGMVSGTPPSFHALSRGSSGSSKGSGSGFQRFGDEISRLSDDFAGIDVAKADLGASAGAGAATEASPYKPPSPPGLDINASAPNAPVAVDEITPLARHPVRSMTANVASPNRRLPPLMTNPDVLASLSSSGPTSGLNAQSQTFLSRQGPASAAAYVPPIGHSHLPASRPEYRPNNFEGSRGNFTAAPGSGAADWSLKKEMLVGNSSSSAAPSSPFPTAVGVNPLADAWPAGGGFGVGLAMQQQAQIQLLQTQMQQAMQVMDMMKAQGHQIPPGFPMNGGTPPVPHSGFNNGATLGAPAPVGGAHPPSAASPAVDSPIDIPALIASKGYNPVNFDLRPQNARFFVIKSYTEEDVHKSLKYEIWASTDLGNKRLDRAFRESADKGPIYLFFSVNGSGHFAGMAQMLTPVDYSLTSNVWASDKWKGVLKVRWIYIKDVPLASLRHIRLSTSSRDTQEVPYAAGLEVLKIISTFQSRTSLLQDFHWYEARTEAGPEGATAPPTHPPHYATRTTSNQQPQAPNHNQYSHQQHQQHPQHPQHQQFAMPPPTLAGSPALGMPVPNGGRRYYGDWRTKGVEGWAKQWFTEELTSTEVKGVTVHEVKDVVGDCEVGMRKSKLVTIYDLNITMVWKAQDSEGNEIKGTLVAEEVAHDMDEDEYVFNSTVESSGKEAEAFNRIAKKELANALRPKFQRFPKVMVEVHGKDLLSEAAADSEPSSGAATPVSAPSTSATPAAAAGSSVSVDPKAKFNTATVKASGEFACTAEDLFNFLTDEAKIPAWSRNPAQMKPEVGAEMSLFGGNISGKVTAVSKPTSFTTSWRAPTWPADYHGSLEATLAQGSNSTTLSLRLTGVPVGKEDEAERNLNIYYINGLKSIGLVRRTASPSYKQRPSGRGKKAKPQPPSRWSIFLYSGLPAAISFGVLGAIGAAFWYGPSGPGGKA